MRLILMILALCASATAPRADTQLTPWLFDLRQQFDDCIKTPSDNPYNTCQGVLFSGFTLRRELAYALDDCRTANIKGCVAALNDAGFPADTLHIATLESCVMLDGLNDVDIREIPAGSCIE